MNLFSVLVCFNIITAVQAIENVRILNAETKTGENIIIGCRFSGYNEEMENSLQINWQREKNDRTLTVHTYYDGYDRLQNQAVEYRNRTQLFYSELRHGNASLLLYRVKLSDNGIYRCSVTDKRGSDNAEGMLKVHAKLSAPVVTVLQNEEGYVANCQTSSSDPHATITWSYMQTTFTSEVVRPPAPTSMTSEGLFKFQSILLLRRTKTMNICCSLISKDTAQPLKACKVIPINSKAMQARAEEPSQLRIGQKQDTSSEDLEAWYPGLVSLGVFIFIIIIIGLCMKFNKLKRFFLNQNRKCYSCCHPEPGTL